ncbi:myoneurin isoform X2 [Hemitrygon akajei]|uniref:myoneurin isoform X2 n=1 Tax=Hemitrygon akajei TaxID=2704970 RepID=UPI003BF993C8
MKQMHHCKQLLDQLQRQRLDGFLCDCTVVIGQLQFKAHRNVLAAFSSYFQAVYELSLVNDVVFLDHNHISSEGFQKLLDFVYTGNIHVDGSNAAVIHAAAAYLQMEDVVSICKAKLESIVINSNSDIKALSDAQGNTEPSCCLSSAGTKMDIEQQGPETVLSCGEVTLPASDPDSEHKIEELQLQSKSMDRLSGNADTKKPKTSTSFVLQVNNVSASSERKFRRIRQTSGCTQRKIERRINESAPQLDTTTPLHTSDSVSQSVLCNDDQNVSPESETVQKTNGKQNRRCLQRNDTLLREAREVIAGALTNIFVSTLATGEVPEDWRVANVVPLFKKGTRDNPGNYRPRKSKLLAADGCAESPDDREGNGKQLKMKPMCNMCGKMFSEASSLRRHMRIHKGLKPYVCQLCAKAFTQCNQLKTHVRTHTGEKPYQCDTCDKSFAQKCQLVFHNRMHHGEKKPYSCDVCNLQFATSSNLKIHARKHSGEKPYICDWCGQRFAQASTLTYHVRRHTGEKPYVCDTCGKAFAVSSSLITHARKHTGEKPYSCHLCNKSFISSGELSKHTRSHTGEKPFICELCGNSYSDVKNLKKHNNKAHAMKRTDRSDEGMDVEQESQEDPDLNVPLSVSERTEHQPMLLPISDGPSLSTEHLLRPTTYPETQLIFLQQLY